MLGSQRRHASGSPEGIAPALRRHGSWPNQTATPKSGYIAMIAGSHLQLMVSLRVIMNQKTNTRLAALARAHSHGKTEPPRGTGLRC